jgi:LacI family transcriptional regulator
LLIGALEESSRIGAQLVLHAFQPGRSGAPRLARLLAENGVAGALLPSPLCDCASLIEALQAVEIPIVAIAPGRPRANTLCVRMDDHAAAREMTQHLLALGHRRIGFVRGNPRESASEECWRGFIAALRTADIGMENIQVEPGWTYRSGLEAGRRLLDARPRPTAIFASNDELAAAVIAEAHHRGVDVPGSLSVVGFGDGPVACNIWPELTTIHAPVAEMAMAAVGLLVQAIRSARSGTQASDRCRPPAHRLLPHRLVMRGSAARAP